MVAFDANKYSFDEDGFIRLRKDLNYHLSHLDSQNVKRIYTNRTEVKSENGETVIDGPLLDMYDLTPTLRLRAGYSSASSEFVFNMYDSAGDPTIQLNDQGQVLVSEIFTSHDVYVGKRLFVNWESTSTSLSTKYDVGMFLMTPTSDNPVSGEQYYIGHMYTTKAAGSTVFPYSHTLELESSARFNMTAMLNIRMAAYGEFYSLTDTTGKSTDYFAALSHSGLMLLNTLNYSSGFDSTEIMGTYIGTTGRDLYFQIRNTSNKVACEGTQRHYDLVDDLAYIYARNIRQYDESLSTHWVSGTVNANVYQTLYYRSIGYTRPAMRNSSSNANWLYMQLTTAEGLAPFDALSFNDGSLVSTTYDYIVWSFYVVNATNISSSGLYLQLGNTSNDNYNFRAVDVGGPIQNGFNTRRMRFTERRTVEGAPNLNAVSWLRMGCWLDGAASPNDTIISMNYFGVVRERPVALHLSSDQNIFQKYDPYNSTWTEFGYNAYFDQIAYYDTNLNNLAIGCLQPKNEINNVYLNQQHRDNFSLYCKYVNQSSDEGSPVIGQLFDANNYWWMGIDSNTMKAFVVRNSTIYDSVTKAMVNPSSVLWQNEMWITRSPDGYIDLVTKDTNERTNALESFIPTSWGRENIFYGQLSTVHQYFSLLDWKVKPYDK